MQHKLCSDFGREQVLREKFSDDRLFLLRTVNVAKFRRGFHMITFFFLDICMCERERQSLIVNTPQADL